MCALCIYTVLGCVYEYVHVHSAKKHLSAKTILRNPTLNLSHEEAASAGILNVLTSGNLCSPPPPPFKILGVF